ncbi:MAG: hypothetical protein JWM86_1748 [Thermoleophilia bacterium]|nr:hypothetical protein [Thermoleophilia bacterium]
MTGIDRQRGLITPPSLPAPPSPDPTKALLATGPGKFIEAHAGDVCSALGIVGAAALVINHRSAKNPLVEQAAERIVLGSMAAGGVDTAIQARNLIANDERSRGAKESSVGSVVYAATGLIPGASVGALRGLHRHPTPNELAGVALVSVNAGVLGYELVHRGPKIISGTEDASGYGSLAASAGGFVVAQRMLMRH